MHQPGVHLYLQELGALFRGRYLWYALAALYTLFLFLMVGPGLRDLEVFLYVVYLLAPALFAPMAALQFAGPRASRFVQAVYTAPVGQSTYFFAKLSVLLSTAGFYYLVTGPFLILHWVHVGIPQVFIDHMLGGLLLILFAVAFGSLTGIIFTGRSVAAPVIVSLLPFLLLLGTPLVFAVQGLLDQGVEIAPWQLFALRILHLGPYMNITEILGVPPWMPVVENSSWVPTLFLLSMAGLLATALWIYLMHQSTETWKDTLGARTLVIIVALFFLALPALAPVTSYTSGNDFPEDLDERRGQNVIVSSRLVIPGTHPVPGSPEPPLPVGAVVDRDLYLHFLVPPVPLRLVDVNVTVSETDAIRIQGADGVTVPFVEGETLEHETDEIRNGTIVIRVPVVVEAIKGNSLMHIQYRPIVHTNVTIQDTATEENGTRYLEDRDIIFARAEVPGALVKSWLAGGVLPVLFLIIGISRDLRRR